jgi:hypothetical protein
MRRNGLLWKEKEKKRRHRTTGPVTALAISPMRSVRLMIVGAEYREDCPESIRKPSSISRSPNTRRYGRLFFSATLSGVYHERVINLASLPVS